jgi:chaperonin GroEL (HSP60 family)
VRLPLLQSIIELSRTQDEEVGDGTTSVIILGGSAGTTAGAVQQRLDWLQAAISG